MKRAIKRAVLLIFAILAFPGGIAAQGESLNLEGARELALLNSRSLAGYNLAIQSSVLSEKTFNHQYLPSLSLSGRAESTFLTKDGFSRDLTKDLNASAGIGLSYSLPLWDGGINAVQKAINSLDTEIARQNALAEYFNVLDSADAAYYGALEAAAALLAAESSLETAALSLSVAEIRRESGMISEADYLQALSEKAGRESARNQSRMALSLARLELRELLGLKETPALEEADFESRENLIRLLAETNEETIIPLLDAARKQVETRNPAMVKASLSASISEKNLSIARRGYSPTLETSLSTGLRYSKSGGLEPSGTLSVTATIPLDFWVKAAEVKRQKLSREQAALDYRGEVSSLEMELHRNILDLISEAGQIVSSRRALDYAQRNFDYALELYRLQGSSVKDLSDAETLYRNSGNQLTSARYAFLSGLSKIRSMGVFDSDEEVIAFLENALSGRP